MHRRAAGQQSGLGFDEMEVRVASNNEQLTVIEIPEDAYKQNAIYRPWDVKNPITTSSNFEQPATKQHVLTGFAGFNNRQSAAQAPVQRTVLDYSS